jgi:hypothetical protein
MNNSHAPLGGDSVENEELLMGYGPLAKFLTSRCFPISKSSLQKIGRPSVNQGPPVEGYWGNLPAFRPSRALEWARSRIRPTRGQAPSKCVPENNACGTPAEQQATSAESVA